MGKDREIGGGGGLALPLQEVPRAETLAAPRSEPQRKWWMVAGWWELPGLSLGPGAADLFVVHPLRIEPAACYKRPAMNFYKGAPSDVIPFMVAEAPPCGPLGFELCEQLATPTNWPAYVFHVGAADTIDMRATVDARGEEAFHRWADAIDAGAIDGWDRPL